MSVIVKDLIKNYYSIDPGEQLDIDFAVRVLARKEELTPDELIIIHMMMEGAHSDQIAKQINVTSPTVNLKFNKASEKIAKYLGENYCDDEIIRKVERKLGRQLTDLETRFCWYMIKFYGRKMNKDLNIFNFKVDSNGRFTTRGKDKAEGQVGVQTVQ